MATLHSPASPVHSEISRRTRRPTKAAPAFACRLVSATVEVNGSLYMVEPIPAGEFGSAAFRLSKVTGKGDGTYDVIRTHAGLVECDCPDYEARHRGLDCGTCKHGAAMVALGLLAAPMAPTAASATPPVTPADKARSAAFGIRLPAAIPAVEQPAPAPCCPADEPAPCAACVEAPEPAPAAGFADELADAIWPDWTDEPLGIRLAPDPDDLADAKPDQPGHSRPFGPRDLDADAPADEPELPVDEVGDFARAWWAGYTACLADLDIAVDRMHARRGEMMAEGGTGLDDFDMIPAGCLAGHPAD